MPRTVIDRVKSAGDNNIGRDLPKESDKSPPPPPPSSSSSSSSSTSSPSSAKNRQRKKITAKSTQKDTAIPDVSDSSRYKPHALQEISESLKNIHESNQFNSARKLQMYQDAVKLLVQQYKLQDLKQEKMVKQLKAKLGDVRRDYDSRLSDYAQKIAHYQEIKYENERLMSEMQLMQQRKASLEMQESPDVVKLLNNWELCRQNHTISQSQVNELNKVIFELEQEKAQIAQEHIAEQHENRKVNEKIVESLEYKINQLFKVQMEKDRAIEDVQREKKIILQRLMETKNAVNKACQAQYAKHKSLQIQQSTALAECMKARHELQVKSDQQIAQAKYETRAIQDELERAYSTFQRQFNEWKTREQAVNEQFQRILEKRNEHEETIQAQKQEVETKLNELETTKRQLDLQETMHKQKQSELKLKETEQQKQIDELKTEIGKLTNELQKKSKMNGENEELKKDIKSLLLANRDLKRSLRQEISNKHEYFLKLQELNKTQGKSKQIVRDNDAYSFAEVSLKNMNNELTQKQKELETAKAKIAQLKLESQHILSVHEHNKIDKRKSQEANLERKRLNSIIKKFQQDLDDKADALENLKNDLQYEKDRNKLLERKLEGSKAASKEVYDLNRKLLQEQTSKKKDMYKLQKKLSRQLKAVANIQSSQNAIQELQEKENEESENRIRNLQRIINKTS